MKSNLRTQITRYLTAIIGVMMAFVMVGMIGLQLTSAITAANDNAESFFDRIGSTLETNAEELEIVQADYSDSCLSHAETVAYILQARPEIIEDKDIEELYRVAAMVQVDEIHVFDTSGEIFFGTQPQYYGYTFDSGVQMNFFKPMLTDHSLQLVQGIEANTAEGKPVQYSAVWSQDEKFILQIGMYPDRVLAAIEKNELSYIFSMLRTTPGIDLYAIDEVSGLILGCTISDLNGKHITELGMPDLSEIPLNEGFFDTIGGTASYVTFSDVGDNLVCYAVSCKTLFSPVIKTCIHFAIGLALLSVIIIFIVSNYMENYVIRCIYRVNESLRGITEGNLDTIVEVNDYSEFEELSIHINEMVRSLMESRKQIEILREHRTTWDCHVPLVRT